MPEPMTRDEARVEAQRRAEETDKCQVVLITCLTNWYSVMSRRECGADDKWDLVVDYAWPGEGE